MQRTGLPTTGRQRALWALIPLLALSCSSALPRRTLPQELGKFAVHAEQHAKDARRHAQEAGTELERSEMLLAEAEALLEQAEAAERRCAELVKKIPKRRTRKVYRVRPKKEEKNKEEKEKDVPKYSPSDAPLEAVEESEE